MVLSIVKSFTKSIVKENDLLKNLVKHRGNRFFEEPPQTYKMVNVIFSYTLLYDSVADCEALFRLHNILEIIGPPSTVVNSLHMTSQDPKSPSIGLTKTCYWLRVVRGAKYTLRKGKLLNEVRARLDFVQTQTI